MTHIFDYRGSAGGVGVDVNYLFVANTNYVSVNNLFHDADGITPGTFGYFDDALNRWVYLPTSQAVTGVVDLLLQDTTNSSDVLYRDLYGTDLPASFDASRDFTGVIGSGDGIDAYFRLFGIAEPQLNWDNSAIAASLSTASDIYQANIEASLADYAAQLDAVLATVVADAIEFVAWGPALGGSFFGDSTPQTPGFVMNYTPSAGTALTYGDFLGYSQDTFGRTYLSSQGDLSGGHGSIFGADETVELLLTEFGDLVNASEMSAGTLIIDLAGGNDTAQLFYDENLEVPDLLRLDAGTGDDSITLGAFFDAVIDLGSGNDHVDFAYAPGAARPGGGSWTHNVDGGSGDDVISGAASHSILIARGGTGQDTIYGGDGDDWLDGGAHADFLQGGEGNDTYVVTQGDVVDETAGQGIDTIRASVSFILPEEVEILVLTGAGAIDGTGNDGANGITGNRADNVLSGEAGADTLLGGAGNDTLNGGAGADLLNGGSGTDTATYADATAGLRADLQVAANNTDIAAGDTFVSIENLIGSQQNDDLRGNSGANLLCGLDGNDLLNGRNGNDTLCGEDGDDRLFGGNGDDLLEGGAGNDILNGGAGADMLNGGSGTDTATYADATAGLRADLQVAANNTRVAAGDTFVSIENLIGSQQNDDLRGNSGANLLRGLGGNDVLNGRHGNDTLRGEDGDDRLFGGSGDDRLEGGAGNDTLNGGLGADLFVFAGPGGGLDTVTDFTPGLDRIALELASMPELGATGPLSAANFALGAAADADDFILYDAGALFFDADGSGAGSAVQIGTFAGAPMLTAADFLIF